MKHHGRYSFFEVFFDDICIFILPVFVQLKTDRSMDMMTTVSGALLFRPALVFGIVSSSMIPSFLTLILISCHLSSGWLVGFLLLLTSKQGVGLLSSDDSRLLPSINSVFLSAVFIYIASAQFSSVRC